MREIRDIQKSLRLLFRLALTLFFIMALVVLMKFNFIEWPAQEATSTSSNLVTEEVLPGEIGTIDIESGLIIDHGLILVKSQCGACHSTKLVAQNKFSREGWLEVIRWMQEKQNLWDLGDMEAGILDYLEKNCAPGKTGRRKNLEKIDWYVLNE